MTSHFTGGGPQSSWGPPPHFSTTARQGDRRIHTMDPSYTYSEIRCVETHDPILQAKR